MRKILFVLIAVMALITVSCSDYDSSQTCSVKLGRLIAKSSSGSVDGDVANPAELYWRYTAVKTDLGSITGQTGAETAIQTQAGYEGVVLSGFAPGDWTLTIYGYLTNSYASSELIYKGVCEARLTWGKTHSIGFVVEIQDGSNGKLKTIRPISILGSDQFDVECVGTYQSNSISSPDSTGMQQGLWTLKYTFKDKDTNKSCLGSCTVQALILNGATTTVTLTYEEDTGSFKAQVNTPSIDDWTSVPVSYEVGDVGPAGGYIFYKADAVQTSTYVDASGQTRTYQWKYLEVAPANASTSSVAFGYNRKSGTNATVQSSLDTLITEDDHSTYNGNAAVGQGRLNTSLLVNAMGTKAYSSSSGTATTASYAAKLCDDYTYGGYNDWFLPSIEELRYIYENLYSKSIGTWKSYYWSSSECSAEKGWFYLFSSNSTNNTSRQSTAYVRAVRAF